MIVATVAQVCGLQYMRITSDSPMRRLPYPWTSSHCIVLLLMQVLDMVDAGVDVDSFISAQQRLDLYAKHVRSGPRC